MPLKFWLLLITLFFAKTSNALLLSGQLGFGNSSTSNEVSYQEGPFVQVYSVESLINSKLTVGVEHIRSLSQTFNSSIALTGGLIKMYINNVPSPYIKAESLKKTSYSFRDFGFFIGSGIGFSQSSKLPEPSGLSSNAAGIYLSPRVGMDFQLSGRLGSRSELVLAQSLIGSGQISVIGLTFGLYFFL
jgi:hypothetical protein